jgi:hypothetical protein
MTDSPEDTLARAERHGREGERHVSHQLALIETLDRDGHQRAAEQARRVLATLQDSLKLAREDAQRERERRGGPT